MIASMPLAFDGHVSWDPIDDPGAPRRGDHRGKLVLVVRDLFASASLAEAFVHSGTRKRGVYEVYVWDRRAIYVTPSRHPGRMRAIMRIWGGYDPDGQLQLSNEYRDFSENHVPAIRAERRESIDIKSFVDLAATPAPLRALVLGPDGAYTLELLEAAT